MRLSGTVWHAILVNRFEDVMQNKQIRTQNADYPLMYDPHTDMAGHAVVVPCGTVLSPRDTLQNSICICLDEAAYEAANQAKFPTMLVKDNSPKTSAQSVFNHLQDMFVRIMRWDAETRSLVENYAGFRALLETCLSYLGFPCALIDSRYRIICSTIPTDSTAWEELRDNTEPGRSDELLFDIVDALMASPQYSTLRSSQKAFPLPSSSRLLMCNVFAKGERIGALVLSFSGERKDVRLACFAVEHLAHSISALYEGVGSYGSAIREPNLLRGLLSRILEGGSVDFANVERLLASEGFDERTRFRLLQFERSFTYEDQTELGYLTHRIENALPHAYCITASDTLFALATVGDRSGNEWRSLPAVLRDTLVKAGVSREFSSVRQLTDARIQTEAALRQGNADNPTYWLYRFDDYALEWVIANDTSAVPLECIAHPTVVTLLEYDRAHDTQLLNTLSVFIRCRYSATEAARELFVARSTLLNRLERIQEISPVDLDNLRERTYLELSLVMLAHR